MTTKEDKSTKKEFLVTLYAFIVYTLNVVLGFGLIGLAIEDGVKVSYSNYGLPYFLIAVLYIITGTLSLYSISKKRDLRVKRFQSWTGLDIRNNSQHFFLISFFLLIFVLFSIYIFSNY